jgi:DNA-binding response OmpR family regulator
MKTTGDRILVVENDPEIRDLISRQTLKPMGYRVAVVDDVYVAIRQAIETIPDLLIANLSLPGLKATDLLIALNSQGVDIPLLVISERGTENDILQAFRAGAVDYLYWPARDAEILSAVERALRHTRGARTSKQLDQKLKSVNKNLERKVSQLTIILELGKAVVSITDQRVLFSRIVAGAVKIADADIGWLTLHDEESKAYLQVGQHNLPPGWGKKMNQPMDGGISSLVVLSGESLLIQGKALERFKVSLLGKSAAVIPIKVQTEVIGILFVVRKAEHAFDKSEQALLEAIADFASISLVNARLFQALEETAESVLDSEQQRYSVLASVRGAVRSEIRPVSATLESLLDGRLGKLSGKQRKAIETMQKRLKNLSHVAEHLMSPSAALKK